MSATGKRLMTTDVHMTIKTGADAIAIVTTIGTLFQWLPAIASLFSIIWMAIRIYETRTVQKMLGNEVPQGANDE